MAGAVSPISDQGPRLVQQITTPPPTHTHPARSPLPPPPSPRWWRVPWAGRPRKGKGTQGRPSAQRWRSSGICKNSRGRVNRVTRGSNCNRVVVSLLLLCVSAPLPPPCPQRNVVTLCVSPSTIRATNPPKKAKRSQKETPKQGENDKKHRGRFCVCVCIGGGVGGWF